MAGTAPYFPPSARRFSVRCQRLSLEISAQGRLDIIVTKPAPTASQDQTACRQPTRVLPLTSCSGPFFIYADPKKAGEDNRVDRRFGIVGFEHHIKMDHA